MASPLLHNRHIGLRAPEPEDLELMFRLENDEDVWENGGVTGPYSRYQLKKYIAEAKNDIFADGQLRLMIETCEGETVGIIDLFNFDARNHRAEVGIVVRKEYRQKGFGQMALDLLERHAFGVIGLHQLYVYVRKPNKASLELFLRSGYVLAGTLADWICMGGSYQDVCLLQKTYRENPTTK